SNISFLDDIQDTLTNRWLTSILAESYQEREKIRLTLEHSNIESKPLWKPLHLQPVFSKFPSYVNGISEDLFKRGLCLPSGSNLTNLDLKKVESAIKQVDFIK
ncbi:MAG TPA: pyridoxal phosphate-dependent aminotransferase, partial [Flavobacteriaceae bacterium]|nr:pyridoxal phosphate-dependent aminotransferase [Flavobacteriaceae bacterium]